jgi:mannose-6-phosphate isomerase-like protein (cupin superfamily)
LHNLILKNQGIFILKKARGKGEFWMHSQPKKVNENELKFRHGDHGPKYFFRGPRYEWGVIVLKPGQELGAHYHEEVEETFYFEEGSGIMKIDDQEYPINIGDAFRIEPKQVHNIICKDKIRTIFIKCPYLPDDKVSV